MEDVLDCSADNSCDDGGNMGDINVVRDGIKLSNATLLQETTLALQQLSIGKFLFPFFPPLKKSLF